MIQQEIGKYFQLDPEGMVRGQRRKVLLVQCDWELGMNRLGRDLVEAGHEVSKVAFCFPDLIFRAQGIETIEYRKPLEGFDVWFEELIKKKEIDTLLMYNPHRPYNRIACRLAEKHGLGVVQFDQGLLRPLHVSVFFGAQIPFDSIAKLWDDEELRNKWQAPNPPTPLKSVSAAKKNINFGFFVLLALLSKPLFPNYRDQQKMKLLKHLGASILYFTRFVTRSHQIARYSPLVKGDWKGRYFLVPLQLGHDAQIQEYSPFESMNQFINIVADSFLEYASPDDKLIFKIHPLDRGYRTFNRKIREVRQRVGHNRVLLVDRVSLDDLIENSKGVLTVNSTVGLTALRHGKAVKTLGRAVYDLEGLTHQGDLETFWSQPCDPVAGNVDKFMKLLENTVQGRGTLSSKCYHSGYAGILWPTQVARTLSLPYYLYPPSESEQADCPSTQKHYRLGEQS